MLNEDEKLKDKTKSIIISKIKVILISVVVIFLVVMMFFGGIFTINTGGVGIISTFGKVDGIRKDGLHFKIPFVQSVSKLETREQLYLFTKPETANKLAKSGSLSKRIDGTDNSLEVSTRDIQTINIEATVQASIGDPETIYTKFKGFHEDRLIRPRVREVIQSTISKYTIEEFVSKRTEISQKIFNQLKEDLRPYGLILSNVSIVNHDFSDKYEEAIEAKKVTEQAVERAKSEQEKLKVEAENRVKLAELELKEKEIKAKSNKVISNSLSENLIRQEMIKKWNGMLPKVTSGNSIITDSILTDKILNEKQ